jgi:hypothetical protein
MAKTKYCVVIRDSTNSKPEGRAYVSRNYRTCHGCELGVEEAYTPTAMVLRCRSFTPPAPTKSWGSAQIPSWAAFAPSVQRGARGSVVCSMCGGSGQAAMSAINGPFVCPTCQGTGAVLK